MSGLLRKVICTNNAPRPVGPYRYFTNIFSSIQIIFFHAALKTPDLSHVWGVKVTIVYNDVFILRDNNSSFCNGCIMIAFNIQAEWVKTWAEVECIKCCKNVKGSYNAIIVYTALSTAIYKNKTMDSMFYY